MPWPEIPTDPVEVERSHVQRMREMAAAVDPQLAAKLYRMAEDLDRHAEALAGQQAALAARRRRLLKAMAEWRRVNHAC